MYFFEKALYQSQLCADGDTQERDEEYARRKGEAEKIRATGVDGEGNHYWRIDESVSDTPRARAVLYTRNKRFLEFRTPFDEWRGLVTAFVLVASYAFIFVPLLLAFEIIIAFVSGEKGGFSAYFWGTLTIAVIFAWVGYTVRQFNIYGRLEILVQRRLLVRFDRVNRKVYLHRPSYAGGVTTLDWDKVICEAPKKDVSHVAGPLTLLWYPQDTPSGLLELLSVGRINRTETEGRDTWEYIRRFMEDGPDSVPKERLIGKFPWPWRALALATGRFWGFFYDKAPVTIVIGLIMLTPAILLYAFFTWLSLLLCWEPVYPRSIRVACSETFMDVFKLRVIDFFSWAMLVGIVWAVLHRYPQILNPW